jgi:hypothetical protein
VVERSRRRTPTHALCRILHIRYQNQDLVHVKEDVRAGVVAARIVAHSPDIAEGIPGAIEKDRTTSCHRRDLDWDGMVAMAINPEATRKRFQFSHNREICTMCGELVRGQTGAGLMGEWSGKRGDSP